MKKVPFVLAVMVVANTCSDKAPTELPPPPYIIDVVGDRSLVAVNDSSVPRLIYTTTCLEGYIADGYTVAESVYVTAGFLSLRSDSTYVWFRENREDCYVNANFGRSFTFQYIARGSFSTRGVHHDKLILRGAAGGHAVYRPRRNPGDRVRPTAIVLKVFHDSVPGGFYTVTYR